MSRTVSGTGRVVQPNIRRAFSDETCRGFPSSYSRPRATGSKIAIARTRKSGTEKDGTFPRLVPQPLFEDFGDVGHPVEIARADEALSRSRGHCHRQQLQCRDVAHVDQVEAEMR